MSVSATTEEAAGTAELEEIYQHSTARKLTMLGVLLISLVVIALAATATGVAGISVSDVARVIVSRMIPGLHLATVSDLAETVVMELRLPRILLAILTGLSLAGAGAVMQGFYQPIGITFYTGVIGRGIRSSNCHCIGDKHSGERVHYSWKVSDCCKFICFWFNFNVIDLWHSQD